MAESSSSHRAHWDSFFRAEIGKESPRAAVILAAAMLEQALDALLRARLVAAPTQSDSFFDGPYAPLASFSAKIDMAYRIGLISSSWSRDLHLVRRIRNDFAHNVTGCTFDDAPVRSRVLELTRSQGVVDSAVEVRPTFATGPAGDFQVTVSWMLYVLWGMAETTTPIPAAAAFSFAELVADVKGRKRRKDQP
jgi:hypothetical protein